MGKKMEKPTLTNNLLNLRQKQDKIFIHDIIDNDREQDFLYFLGNHPYLFEEFTNIGLLTNAEVNYIVGHFYDYEVDPRTFENEFKRQMREALPRYNYLKSIEIKDELFEIFDDKYTREITSNRLNLLTQGNTHNTSGTTNNDSDNKQANKQLPMQTTGNNFDNVVKWENGASNISESKNVGSTTISQEDIDNLTRNTNENGNTTESYTRERTPVDTIDKIWGYLIKPKAIEYLTQQLSYAFSLVY